MSATATLTTRVVEDFDDPLVDRERWNALVAAFPGDCVYLRWEFQRAWWETLGSGRLLIVVAERGGEPVAIAPLYVESRMVYFVGSSFEFDRLDFIGEASSPDVLAALLDTARRSVDGFCAFMFYFVPDATGTGRRLRRVAAELDLSCYEEERMVDPTVAIDSAAVESWRRRLARLERPTRRDGPLSVVHLDDAGAIEPELDGMIEQHLARWAQDDNPSRMRHGPSREIWSRITELAAGTDLLRFARLDWRGEPVAYHYGYQLDGRWFCGVMSFALDAARYSPGRILLRHWMIAASARGARLIDFGTGDQRYKLALASEVEHVRSWGMYPRSAR
jgi:CelD/BcsL family acetyltransferase involved in cellulose biosynthesis